MPRVKRGTQHVKRRKNILSKAKGYKWGRKNKIKHAKEAIVKAGVHAYVDRKKKKRTMRGLQNIKISAFVKMHDLSYSKFIHLLKENNIELDRKILAELASQNKPIMEKIVLSVKK
jgi:large subunit ribosomal protein L20